MEIILKPTKEKLIELLEDAYSLEEIANKYKMTKQEVFYMYKDFGLFPQFRGDEQEWR